jgi:phospholipid/cholesterol/gamma-HCH transport system ATP-binding protein
MVLFEEVTTSLGGKEILRGLSIAVPPGELLALIGPSGSGKSVFLKHIVGLLRPDRGRVLIAGQDVSRAKEKELRLLRDRIGFVFQGSALLKSISVFDNIALPLREREHLSEDEIHTQVHSTLERVGMSQEEGKFPDDLSGGMKKRIGLARAVVGRRDLFLYDEPTSELDPIASQAISRLIRTLHQDLRATSIIVTHDLPLVEALADRVAILADGRIAQEGTLEDLRRSSIPAVREFLEASPLSRRRRSA